MRNFEGESRFWYEAEKGRVHERVLDYVASVEQAQAELYEQFVQLEYLYDPLDPSVRDGYEAQQDGVLGTGPEANVVENGVAANVDTLSATITTTKIRARFMTDGAPWSEQRRAKKLEYYGEGLTKLLGLDEYTEDSATAAIKKGTGFVKVVPDMKAGCVVVEHIPCDDVVVDEGECRGGKEPRQFHHRMMVPRKELTLDYPEFADKIKAAQGGNPVSASANSSWRYWAEYRPIERDDLVVVESWVLPFGKKGSKKYLPGRHTKVADGIDLLDEPYHDPFFPVSKIVFSKRGNGYFGISLTERLAGHQRCTNKLNWQIDRGIDQWAVPTQFVHQNDAQLAVETINRVGTIVPYTVAPPTTVIPQANSPEVYQRLAYVKQGMFEQSGVSVTSAMGRKPAGIDSGVGLRELKDQQTVRHASFEKGYEIHSLNVKLLALYACKKLGSKAPRVVAKTPRGNEAIDWGQVDMDVLKVQVEAASNLSRTPAGRLQQALEWAQAGVITMDEWRRLTRHPDLEAAMSLYTAALEDIERCIEDILDGATDIVPEPYQNLKMGVWRFQQAYHRAKNDGADESVCEALRQWIDIAAYMVSKKTDAQQAAMTGALTPPDQAGMLPPGPAQLALPPGPPQDVAMSAFAPESMGIAAV